MQLKKDKQHTTVATVLSAATCSLLMAAPMTEAADGATDNWRMDAGAMHYTEDDRITVNEAVVRLKRQLDEDSSVSFRTTYDSVSGASPTGAVELQSVSGASGGAYLADFETTRIGVGVDYETAFVRQTRLSLTLDHSSQDGYSSSAIGGTLSRDFNQRNTTLVAGVGYSDDIIDPEGGIHYGLDATTTTTVRTMEDEKDQFDLQLGVTQVLTRTRLLQVNFVTSRARGYMSNPYKVISVVNEVDGSILPGYSQHYDKRPRERDSNALYTQLNQGFGDAVGYLSYRYFWDDWGIKAHTVDLRYRHPFGERLYVQPHVRYYQQSAADFYRSMLTNTEVLNLPEYASADYRMAELNTTTFGLKLGYHPGFGGELNARFEVIRQEGEERPDDAIGIQRDNGVFPELDAKMVHIGYSFNF